VDIGHSNEQKDTSKTYLRGNQWSSYLKHPAKTSGDWNLEKKRDTHNPIQIHFEIRFSDSPLTTELINYAYFCDHVPFHPDEGNEIAPQNKNMHS